MGVYQKTVDRTRSRGFSRFWFKSSATPLPAQDFLIAQIRETRTGTNNTDWKHLIENHQNATGSMTGERDIYVSRVANIKNTSKNQGLQDARGHIAMRHLGPQLIGVPTVATKQAHERAVSRFLKNVHKAEVQMSGQVFMGELKEAIHMLRHPAESLTRAISESYLDKLKRIKRRDGKRWKKAISQTWLEGAFGWLPFVQDLSDAVDAYKEFLDKNQERFKNVRGFGKSDQALIEQFFDSAYSPLPANTTKWIVAKVVADNAFCVIRGQVKARAETTPARFGRCFGLMPSEFIPTAWELLPWSFLADYFTNIGDILENSVTDRTQIAWVSESKVKIRLAWEQADYNRTATHALQTSPESVVIESPSYALFQRRQIERNPGSDLSIPSLAFELPGSVKKFANMAALWSQTSKDLQPQLWRKNYFGRWHRN